MSNGSTIQITTKLWFTLFYQQRMYHLPTEATGRRLRPMLKNINPFLTKKFQIEKETMNRVSNLNHLLSSNHICRKLVKKYLISQQIGEH